MANIIFHRPARVYSTPPPKSEFVLVMPPAPPPQQQGGMLSIMQFLLPVMGSMGSVVFFLAAPPPRNPLLFVGVGAMIFMSVGSGFLTRTIQRRGAKQLLKTNRAKYSRYLEQMADRFEMILQQQREVAEATAPAPRQLFARVIERNTLWERRPADTDFLDTRVGTGVKPLAAPVSLQAENNPLAEHDLELLPKAQALVAHYQQIDDLPITIALHDMGVLAICGSTEHTRALARGLFSQVVVAHAPDDVRIVGAFPTAAATQWEWLKWLPHTRRLRQINQGALQEEQLAMLADSPTAFGVLFQEQLLPEIERRRKLSEERSSNKIPAQKLPHFIVVIDGYTPQQAMAYGPPLSDLMQHATEIGVTVICLVTDREDEPSVPHARLELSDAGWLTFVDKGYGGRRHEFIQPDAPDVAVCLRVARAIAPLRLGGDKVQRDLAHDVRLMELLHINDPSRLEVKQLWRPRPRQDLLNVPIGMGADGAPLFLDIREASEGGMGPHGMIIGATGSGKSELLRTIVTSLALTHNPETLNFVLADFKGGASFADLAALPHAAGMITNLQSDMTLVDRMRAALFGEQERRQQLLRTSGNLDNIRQYHAKREQHPEMPPLPYLMIIVDEFAELLSNRPDFLELFIAIGRVGRSLGMHMLLATQRLSEGRIQGLEGHLRYRICLRTFSAAESSAVLGTPDAFYLPSFPGIGYFKVDTNIYRLFKTALITTPYRAISLEKEKAIVIRQFTNVGALTTVQNSLTHRLTDTRHLNTEMDVVIEGLSRFVKEAPRDDVHQVLLPPLSPQVTLTDVFAAAGQPGCDGSGWQTPPPCGMLRVPIGMLDLPEQQKQVPFILDFSGAGGHLAFVGAPQSGKSTLLQTIIASLIVTHSPHDVQLYCIDFGGGLLREFENVPHMSALCGKGELDKIHRVIRQMHGIIEERVYFFREHHIDGINSYRARRLAGEFADVPFGDVFLIVDNLTQLQTEIDQIDTDLAEIVSLGLTYGVHFIGVGNRWSAFKAKLRDTIGTRLELRLNDPMESEMGKAAALSLSQAPAGRGVIKNGSLFQVALPVIGASAGMTQQDALVALVARTRRAWQRPSAPPVLMLPMQVRREALQTVPSQGVVLGIDEFKLEPVIQPVTQEPHFLIFGDGETGKTTALRMWRAGLEQQFTLEEAQIGLIDFRRTSLDALDSPLLSFYACTPAMLKDGIQQWKQTLEARMMSGNVTIEDLRNPKKWQGAHYYLLVDDYETLVSPAGNLLAPLLDCITQGRDIGLHVIMARRVSGTGRTAFETVFQRIKELGTPGIIFSGDPSEGVLLGTQKAAMLPPGRGFLVRRNQRTIQVQTLFTSPSATVTQP